MEPCESFTPRRRKLLVEACERCSHYKGITLEELHKHVENFLIYGNDALP
jgi:hypothetical protein